MGVDKTPYNYMNDMIAELNHLDKMLTDKEDSDTPISCLWSALGSITKSKLWIWAAQGKLQNGFIYSEACILEFRVTALRKQHGITCYSMCSFIFSNKSPIGQ